MKVLFVCSRNRLRSLTAEAIFDGRNGHEVRSVGTDAGARVRVTEGHLGWADLVFVMEQRHRDRRRSGTARRLPNEGSQLVERRGVGHRAG